MNASVARRNIAEVLGEVRGLIPESDRPSVDRLLERFAYKAPEQIGDCWAEAQHWLLGVVGATHLPLVIRPGDEWKVRVIALWMNRPAEEISDRFVFMDAEP